ncbi:VWA domain-containing protein [Candidatus Poribacteria bacterium]|nr:VWA domain-containing protein [Candidatus Poribacteria bacterium]
MTGIAHAAAGGSAARAVDIVFLLDLSGSMENNLRAVGENLATMMSELKSRDADATFGVVKFKSVLFLVFPQSTDVAQYERLLANLRVGGDELALDALSRAAEKVEFRPDVQRRFVLVTDEPLKGEPALTRILPQLIAANIIVDVIGLDVRDHRMLARATGGTWHRIPGDKS